MVVFKIDNVDYHFEKRCIFNGYYHSDMYGVLEVTVYDNNELIYGEQHTSYCPFLSELPTTEEEARDYLNNKDWVNSEEECLNILDPKPIKTLREATGLTQKAFSEFVGIPLRTIQEWESGRRNPPMYVIDLLSFYLDNTFFKYKDNN